MATAWRSVKQNGGINFLKQEVKKVKQKVKEVMVSEAAAKKEDDVPPILSAEEQEEAGNLWNTTKDNVFPQGSAECFESNRPTFKTSNRSADREEFAKYRSQTLWIMTAQNNHIETNLERNLCPILQTILFWDQSQVTARGQT